MPIINFFLGSIFLLAISTLLFLAFEKLLDRSPTSFREKLRLFQKNPKNLDEETGELLFHYEKYFIGSILLATSILSFILLYLNQNSFRVLRLALPIGFLLCGILEIINEYFYRESKIDYSYRRKYGWKFIWKMSYYKELMKNSPIALIPELIGIGFLIFILLIIVLVLLVFVLNRF